MIPSRPGRPFFRGIAFQLAVLSVALGLVLAARAWLHVSRGLRVDYFVTEQWSGVPAASLLTPEVSAAQMQHDWGGPLPPTFSARWYGYLILAQDGLYTFATTSDDASFLSVDGARIVDNGGVHGEETRTGQVRLTAGAHFVLIEYVQAGGFREMRWAWARDDGALEPVPRWALSPGRIEPWKVGIARALDAAGWTLVFVLVAVVAAAAFARGRLPAWAVVQRYPKSATLLLFTALAVAHTWPLASSPATLSRLDNGDTILNQWIMAWVAHQAPREPLALFDANIFHPNRDTLAYSEPLMVQSAFAAPVLWLGGSPVLAYNLVLIAGFALTGWTTSLVIGRWTGELSAGMMAGVLAGVNAHTLTRMPHIQAQHAEFLPLALFALDRLFADPTGRHALKLAMWFVLQAATSIYLLVFTAFALIAAALARLDAWRDRQRRARIAGATVLAALVAGLALLPMLLPYWRAYSEQGLTRSVADASVYSAGLADYLTTPGRFHRWLWSDRVAGGTPMFPGAVGLVLTATAIASGVVFRDRRARMCLAAGVCGLALSFGTKLPGYETVYSFVPLLHAIRAPVRFGHLVVLSVALLAGFGYLEVRRRLPARAWAPLSLVLVVAGALEPLAAPLSFSRFVGVPAIYDTLAANRDAVVVELPFPDPRAVFVNARFMLNSTRHWRPMLNGYSGFLPGSYRQQYERLKGFPDAVSLDALRSEGVTHAFVHLDGYAPGMAGRLETLPALRKVAQEGDIALYRVAP